MDEQKQKGMMTDMDHGQRIIDSMRGCTFSREEADAIKRKLSFCTRGGEKELLPTEKAEQREREHSDWIWENLNRASSGEELLPRLAWDVPIAWDIPIRKIRTYGDL